MLRRIHHLNFVVKDLHDAVKRYSRTFSLDEWLYDEHPRRPVLTARAKIGESWLVLVQPLDTESPPARHLEEHGEGFFLVSFEVDNINAALEQAEMSGAALIDREARSGILNWQVADLKLEQGNGARLQLVEEKK